MSAWAYGLGFLLLFIGKNIASRFAHILSRKKIAPVAQAAGVSTLDGENKMDIVSLSELLRDMQSNATNEEIRRERYFLGWCQGNNRVSVDKDLDPAENYDRLDTFLLDVNATIVDCNDNLFELVDLISDLIYTFEISARAVVIPKEKVTGEMREWLTSDIFSGKVSVTPLQKRYVVMFFDTTDAAHFKMRWC